MPSLCAASSASAISMASARAISVSSGRPAIRCLQGQAIEELHGDETLSVVLADFVDGADVGMVERGRGARFAAESFERLRILRDFFGKEFEGYEASERRVFGFVDHTHAAAAELFDDAVVRDGWPITGAKSYVGGNGKSTRGRG